MQPTLIDPVFGGVTGGELETANNCWPTLSLSTCSIFFDLIPLTSVGGPHVGLTVVFDY